MKKILHLITGLGAGLLLLALLSCTKGEQPLQTPEKQVEIKEQEQEQPQQQEEDETKMTDKIQLTISGTTLPVLIEDNVATRALVAALREGSITYTARDYGGFEKVGALGRSLPTSDTDITTQAGDVILYNGDNIVLFYGSNSWSYTRLGKIQYKTLDELKSFLKAGGGNISVTLSL
ncbi:MAG: hypothetical protein II130_01395 [Bacteroidales bacterium]|nr:hypothetical protein [Bacteroidales bacterium]MBQ2551008.1 hypothetical protein [Bacteroidales bacterium]MBQ3846884.1 hypothetical protein [Bacteroidales bacterium]